MRMKKTKVLESKFCAVAKKEIMVIKELKKPKTAR